MQRNLSARFEFALKFATPVEQSNISYVLQAWVGVPFFFYSFLLQYSPYFFGLKPGAKVLFILCIIKNHIAYCLENFWSYDFLGTYRPEM